MVSTPRNHRYRQKHDPYNEMEEPNIRPSNISRQELSDAEKHAVSDVNHDSDAEKENLSKEKNHNDDTNTIRRREQNQRSDFSLTESQPSYRNSVRGKKSTPSSEQKNSKKKKGTLKKAGPLGAIVAILFGGGFFFYATQSMLAPHLSALYTQATDLQFTSYNMRNARLMSYMLDGGNQIKVTNFTQKYTFFTPYMQKRLINNGIEVGHLTSGGEFETGQAIIGGKTVLRYGGKIVDASSFHKEFASNANFREAYYNAKRGRIAGFFDKSSEIFYKNKGATRDIFDKYKSTGDEKKDMANFQDTVSDRVTGVDGTINTVRTEDDDEEGPKENGEDINTESIDGATPESKARAMVNNIAGKVSNVGVPVCSAMRIANITAVAVSSYQIYQSIAYFLSFMEPISKMMAGEGDASGINESLNFMTQQSASTIQYVDEDGKTTSKTLTGSMLESSGAKLIMGNTASSESAVQPFSFDNITKAATRIAISIGATTTVCSGVTAASAIVSLASTAIPGGKLATFVVGAIAQTIGGIVLTGVVAAIINAMVPYVAKMFASNVFETYTGIPAGELFSQGAAAANFSLATQGSAYMPSSEESVKEQNRHTSRAIAQEAEIDRLKRSPLDVTSPNTFLGSIVSKFSYLSYSNPLVQGTTNAARVVGSSMRSLIPAASAVDQDFSYISNNTECRNLKNTRCDMYGYPIVSSDYSTIDIRPDDPAYLAAIEPNLNDDGSIKDNSELAKFINFCVNRESPWGVTDANILNALQTDGGIIVNNLYAINNIIDVINAVEDVENQAWATGENCINSSDNPRWDSEFKYYQRYVEDMRILYGMDDPEYSEDNPVITYENNYQKNHPIDTSFQGTLSRISGLSKDDVAYLLEYIDYSNQIANYNPSTRDKFGNVQKSEVKLNISQPIVPSFDTLSIIPESIFIDRRNYTV